MERYCVSCGDEFDPIEGNSDRDFCSWECEDYYVRGIPEDMDRIDENTEHYNYGRK